ncbi:hypothetical protein RYX36_022988, partial [Vicia faba]
AEKGYDNHKWETVSTPAVCKYWIKKYRRQVNYAPLAVSRGQLRTSNCPDQNVRMQLYRGNGIKVYVVVPLNL